MPARPGPPGDLEEEQRARVRRWDRYFRWMTVSFFLTIAVFVVLFFGFVVGMIHPVF